MTISPRRTTRRAKFTVTTAYPRSQKNTVHSDGRITVPTDSARSVTRAAIITLKKRGADHVCPAFSCSPPEPSQRKKVLIYTLLTASFRSFMIAPAFSSAQPIRESTCGSSDFALSVNVYSTRGGTSGYTVRVT